MLATALAPEIGYDKAADISEEELDGVLGAPEMRERAGI
jgi:fumarate hydratase class II